MLQQFVTQEKQAPPLCPPPNLSNFPVFLLKLHPSSTYFTSENLCLRAEQTGLMESCQAIIMQKRGGRDIEFFKEVVFELLIPER